MSFSRYTFVPSIKNDLDQSFKMTSKVNIRIKNAVELGKIETDTHTLQEGERLDTLAQLYYSNASLWWVIAAASGIGWSLQVPPGTLLLIPRNISELIGYLR